MRTALTSVEGISDIELDGSTTSGTFKAPKDLDVKATLDKFVEGGNKHIKDWSME